MKIDRNNYEAYLLDYLEGNLSDDLRCRLEIFLAANPDIAEEYESAKKDLSLPVEMPSVDKKSFYRSNSDLNTIPESRFEEFCVAYHEGDLDEEGRSRLMLLIKNDPGKKKIFDLYAALRFSQDPVIRYPLKSGLKKSFAPPLRRILYPVTAAAAALLISFLVFFPRQDKPSSDQQVYHIAPARQESPSVREDISRPSVRVEMPVRQAVLEQTQTRNLLAKADTNAPPLPESIILASIDPIPAHLQHELPVPDESAAVLTKQDRPETASVKAAESPSALRSLASRSENQTVIINRETIFWSAVKASVKGFNSLTENDLALDTEQNRRGEVTEIKVYAENFQFQRRFKRTIQN